MSKNEQKKTANAQERAFITLKARLPERDSQQLQWLSKHYECTPELLCKLAIQLFLRQIEDDLPVLHIGGEDGPKLSHRVRIP
jgi:hypothetical protein